MEGILHFKVRGYTGAAKYFARLLRQWIVEFEKLFERRLQNPGEKSVTMNEGSAQVELPNPAYLFPHDTAKSIATSSDARWAMMPTDSQPQYSQFNQQQAQNTMESTMPSFSIPFTSFQDADLSVLTSDSSDPASRYWTPPVHYPDPPSASGINTDFSGQDLFSADYDFGNFEVNDLMLPAWLGPDLTASTGFQGRLGAQVKWN